MRASVALAALLLAAVLAAGCGGESQPAAEPAASAPAASAPETGAEPAAAPADPREGGLEVDLGEWALALEAPAIRPGRVTFVVRNRGTVPHGFELESEDRRDENGDRRDRDDRFKHETGVLQPGESTELTVDLPPGVYKVECLVDGHDDLGMEGLLEVREDAPLVAAEPQAGSDAVRIAGFAFEPQTLEVASGATVTWTNEDEAPHTVTADGGGFGSETLEQGAGFERRFDRPGSFAYLCAIHPEMRGTVVVR